MNNVVVFGTGNYCKAYIRYVLKKDTVICFADNDASRYGTFLNGIPIRAPSELYKIDFDFVVIFVAKKNAVKIKAQLLDSCIPQEKILFYDEYISLRFAGEYEMFNIKTLENGLKKSKKNIAIVSGPISSYNGAVMAAANLIQAIKNTVNNVVLIASSIDSHILEELCDFGLKIIVYPAFCNITKVDIDWLKNHFDFAIVNCLAQIDCAYKISSDMSCVWWLHNPSDTYYSLYRDTFFQYPQYKDCSWLSRVNVLAVSSIAKRAFLEHFPKQTISLFPYCVADKNMGDIAYMHARKHSGQMTFAIIGRVEQSKAQDVFLSAAARLNVLYSNYCKFLIVGKIDGADYAKNVLKRVEVMPYVKVFGPLSRAQMAELYRKEIDVVVCPSLEDCLPTVITEGLMYGKICIASDNTGMVDYIIDGRNGFLCKAGDENSLFEKMKCCVESFDELDYMRMAARKTYEENFTPEVFAKRFDEIIKGL